MSKALQNGPTALDGSRTPRPNLFLIGASKAGTTSLYEYIEGHPDIYMSRVKEPQFFSPDLPDPRNLYPYPDALDKYLELFAGATTEKWRGEASTYYLSSEQAPGLVHQFNPEARIVATLRNPVEAIYSLHGHLMAYGHETEPSFESALAAEDAQAGQSDERRLKVLRHGTYMGRGRYADQLQPWIDLFPPEQRLIVIFDDLAANPAGELRRLLEFLDVDPDYVPRSFEARNKSHTVRRRVVRAQRSGPARCLRRSVLPRLVGEERTMQLARSFKRSRAVRKDVRRPPLSATTRARLSEELRPDVERLSNMLGRDLVSEWLDASSQGHQRSDSPPNAQPSPEASVTG